MKDWNLSESSKAEGVAGLQLMKRSQLLLPLSVLLLSYYLKEYISYWNIEPRPAFNMVIHQSDSS